MSAAAIRMPEEGDQAEWLRLRRALWPECDPEQHELEMSTILVDDDRSTVFVSPAHGGHLAGFVEVALRPWAEGCESAPVAYVEGIYVRPEERGHGVATALLRAAEAWALARGCREIASDARLDNDVSRALHARLGYEETEVLVHLRKRLNPAPGEEGAT
jgi:aminoglycoside 6'-N-acetyltransferase I